jgi:hypothetical protein
MTFEEEFAARLNHAKQQVRSLRNHTKNVTAVLADFEEWLEANTDPPAEQEAQGHEQNGRITVSR